MSGPFVLHRLAEVALDGYEAFAIWCGDTHRSKPLNPHCFTSSEFKTWQEGWNRAARKANRRDVVRGK